MVDEVQFSVFDDEMDTERVTEILFKTVGEARRKTNVNVRRMDKDGVQLFGKAKNAETNGSRMELCAFVTVLVFLLNVS